ncbi:MAG: bifunctional folylpolyglutamate synthase/dihydrofolate synthase [Muribaculaceae bacterium]|nr:bifunctional folylpolyglutamate synthase/dihydrofolate synthase [Muribaculaceae bacterium]
MIDNAYTEAVEYLYNSTPQFQLIGAAAYKPGLDTAYALDRAFGEPHKQFKTIHIAGTNGKGSTAHTIAAALQLSGYKVGLYTSPHLADFRERIRVNGEKISHEGVVDFVKRYKEMNAECSPSFFELTTIMAFDWFASNGVDVAVIETGLGGRLDTTNIITPELSVITNISFDHTAQLGNTLEAIASEKAGIIKPGVPVVIGEASGSVADIFRSKALSEGSPIVFVEDTCQWQGAEANVDCNVYHGTRWGDITGALSGECQLKNAQTIMAALELLPGLGFKRINSAAVSGAFANVCRLTGLMGRWTIVNQSPLTICDTGHNTGGWQYISDRLQALPRPLIMVIGFVSDKDVDHILEMMPRDAEYIFTQASIPRAMNANLVAENAAKYGLNGTITVGVKEAVAQASDRARATGGSVFIGGSTFVVADYLS